MLLAAQAVQAQGASVLVGVLELQAAAKALALSPGLALLPPKSREQHGICHAEFDLETALAHRPDLIVMGQLAHTNAPGAPYAKRWQEVAQLRLAGIDVFSTVQVQDLASLCDVVGSITGEHLRATQFSGQSRSAIARRGGSFAKSGAGTGVGCGGRFAA